MWSLKKINLMNTIMTDQLKKKVEQAIRLLQSINNEEVELAYSGGKDSDVILELAKMAGIKFRAIYKNTTIDPPKTIKHVKSKGVEIIRPKKNFAQIIEENGFPNQWKRFCCGELKEYKILDKAIQGIRKSESKKRNERYKEPVMCRVYENGKAEIIYPILEWTNEDIAEFVNHYKVKCHPLYYDENGDFHPERRLGCMCCPLASYNKRIKQFKQYPHMVRYYIKNGEKWLKKHPETKTGKRHKTVYDWFLFDVFHRKIKNIEDKKRKTMFDEGIDAKYFLESYFNIKL